MQIKKLLTIFTVCFFSSFIFKNLNGQTEKFLDAFEIVQRSKIAYKIVIKNSDPREFKSYFKIAKAIIIFPEINEGGLLLEQKGVMEYF